MRELLAGGTVINCAAYTDVDGAESDPERAHAVNADGARNVAEAAERVIYVSTDYVFDGSKREPYVESDPIAPLSVYGALEARGRAGHRRGQPEPPHRSLVLALRTPAAGTSSRRCCALGRERGELRVVDDQVGCPTFTGHLAEALVTLAAGDELRRPARGRAQARAPGSNSRTRS